MPLGRTKSRRSTPTDIARAREQRRLLLAVPLLITPLLAFAVLDYGPRSWDPSIVVLP